MTTRRISVEVARRGGARGLGALAGMAFLLLAIAGCVTTQNPFPAPGSTQRPAGDPLSAATSQVIGILSRAGLPAAETTRPFRPAEGPLLAGASRKVVQVSLPAAPDQGFLVIYGLESDAAAERAARDHAAYLGVGFGGRVQYPPGTQFVIRVIGSNVVFYSWLPANAPDPGMAGIADVLSRVGTGVPVPG